MRGELQRDPHPQRRPCASMDPYPAALVVAEGVRHNAPTIGHGVWIPARASLGRDDDVSGHWDRDHFPGHDGLRFSPNALRPSLASSVIASNAIWLSV